MIQTNWREASKVSGVYGGSTLNLAASGARDGNYDLSFDRDSKDLKYLYRFQMQFRDFQESRWYDLVCDIVSGYQIEDSPLAERGWYFKKDS